VPDGATVLVHLEGKFTVKRFFRDVRGAVRLEPADRSLLPLVLRGDRVRVHGVVVGLIRRRGFATARERQRRAMRAGAVAVQARPPLGDLTLRLLQDNVGEWAKLSDVPGRIDARRAGSLRIRELGQSLRALVATYGSVSNLRLRRALLEEAARISREMRYLAAASGWSVHRIRPLLSERVASRAPASRLRLESSTSR
jgi:hypothetical protein